MCQSCVKAASDAGWSAAAGRVGSVGAARPDATGLLNRVWQLQWGRRSSGAAHLIFRLAAQPLEEAVTLQQGRHGLL